ncbi:hypothetical protein CGZ80_16280 [Rhodopirellula sp. MGV]|nr:hypothetical protein CGZ80_16280 [Rhodopirellula sp. MGV]PNY38022.1 hypothetical protein C2E31_04485 [Rhodopirellula baltica]
MLSNWKLNRKWKTLPQRCGIVVAGGDLIDTDENRKVPAGPPEPKPLISGNAIESGWVYCGTEPPSKDSSPHPLRKQTRCGASQNPKIA